MENSVTAETMAVDGHAPEAMNKRQAGRYAELYLFVLPLLCYLGIHFVLQLSLSPTLGADEVEQALLAQGWDLGYVFNQPPLYTWLLWSFYQLLGVGVLAHVLLKYTLLLLTYWLLYLGARRILVEPYRASLATFSLLLIAPFGWNVYQGFTHTVLLSALCAATFYVTLVLAERRSLTRYLVLGLVVGLGLLSKYSYLLFLLGLLGATLCEQRFRAVLLDWRISLAVLLALLVVSPHLWWIVGQHHSADELFVSTLKVSEGQGYWSGVATGMASLLQASFVYLSPFWLFALLLLPRGVAQTRDGVAEIAEYRRLLGYFLLVVFALLLIGIFIAGVTHYKSRWMHPVLLLAPLFFFTYLHGRRLDTRRVRVYIGAIVVLSLLVLAVRVAQIHAAPMIGKYTRNHMPFTELAEQIAKAGFAGGTILAGDEHIGGNFRQYFPRARIMTARYKAYVPPLTAGDGACLVVWNADKGEKQLRQMRQGLFPLLGVEIDSRAQTASVEALLYHSEEQRVQLNYILIPQGVGACR